MGTHCGLSKVDSFWGGDNVRDAHGDWAIFADLGSQPATIESSRVADAVGLQPGFTTEIADAEQAYVQAELKGPSTWVTLPKMLWPRHWHDIDDPVVLLKRALYGHPQAGAFWEEHLELALERENFTKVKGWKSTYRHDKLDLLLIVYVDDSKMSGQIAHVGEGWRLIAFRSWSLLGLPS